MMPNQGFIQRGGGGGGAGISERMSGTSLKFTLEIAILIRRSRFLSVMLLRLRVLMSFI